MRFSPACLCGYSFAKVLSALPNVKPETANLPQTGLSVFAVPSFALLPANTLEKQKYPLGKPESLKQKGKDSERMAQIDENIKKQLDKPQTWFCKYFPKRIRNVGEKEIADRELVYAFKDGKAYEEVARITASSMKERYGETCTGIVFSPVPASTDKKNEIRYKAFCERVCELTGAINGYDHVKVCGERLSIHEHRKAEKEIRKVSILEFDEKWFDGKAVLVYDDVITRGMSYALYANQLESFGANVLGGIFLARTHYRVRN